ncbi:MAG: flavin reductase family protein [Eggerthellaceae bacterium]|nr:flavin reductase family protein [Eggerthellaceae bacterium]
MPQLPAFTAPLEPAEGRDVAALMDPRPVVVVGACAPENAGARERAGGGPAVGFATVIWVTPLSHNPPLVALALREKSHTMGLLRATGAFSLSTLDAADADAAALTELCGNNTGRSFDKEAAVGYVMASLPAEGGPDGAPGAGALPVPASALSYELCTVESVQPAGDHLLVIGRVLAAAARASRDAKGRVAPVETLLCVQHGAYAGIGA